MSVLNNAQVSSFFNSILNTPKEVVMDGFRNFVDGLQETNLDRPKGKLGELKETLHKAFTLKDSDLEDGSITMDACKRFLKYLRLDLTAVPVFINQIASKVKDQTKRQPLSQLGAVLFGNMNYLTTGKGESQARGEKLNHGFNQVAIYLRTQINAVLNPAT